MARPKGSKVIPCQSPVTNKKKCKGRMIGLIGDKARCATCGFEIKFTKKLLRENGKDV